MLEYPLRFEGKALCRNPQYHGSLELEWGWVLFAMIVELCDCDQSVTKTINVLSVFGYTEEARVRIQLFALIA